MQKLGLIFCVILLAGCGKDKNDSNGAFSFDVSKLKECTNAQKNNELKGEYLPEIINTNRCVVISNNYDKERVKNHVAKKTETQELCLWANHGRYDWICIVDS